MLVMNEYRLCSWNWNFSKLKMNEKNGIEQDWKMKNYGKQINGENYGIYKEFMVKL